MTPPIRNPLLTIPRETEEWPTFKERLAKLFLDENTHIYIDTSFLMWLTKIGTTSRKELLSWLSANCEQRVHVPIWAAHEYLKHHIAGTIVNELVEKTDEVLGLVGQTYTYFRPFMDEPSGEGSDDPSVLRATTRSALNALDRLTGVSRQWRRSYEKHAAEVISFINETTPEKTTIYDYFPSLTNLGTGRFVGSIPPGFRDRKKKGSETPKTQNVEEAPADSNRLGDVVFWKELLEHAKAAQARNIVILTNDRKNDWYYARNQTAKIDPALREIKKSWKAIPRAHPMLALEAKLAANVECLDLLDRTYLAALLRDVDEPNVQAFADVAIIPDDLDSEGPTQRRTKLYEERLAAERESAATAALERGYLFADDPKVSNTRASLARALFESRKPTSPESNAILDTWRAGAESARPLQSISSKTFEGYDHNELARLARTLHDRVLERLPGYSEAVVDLASILDRLPLNTAASLYLGLLSSMYLFRKDNKSRIPPVSPIAQILFERQGAEYAANGISCVASRLSDNDFAPLYIPNVDRPPILISIDTEPDTPTIDQLRSLRIGEVELLTAAQAEHSLRMKALFDDRQPIEGDAIIRKACELFALPVAQVERAEMFRTVYTLTDTIGFKRPVDIRIPKERPDGE